MGPPHDCLQPDKGYVLFFSPNEKANKGIIERRVCWLPRRYWLVFDAVKSLCKAASSKH